MGGFILRLEFKPYFVALPRQQFSRKSGTEQSRGNSGWRRLAVVWAALGLLLNGSS